MKDLPFEITNSFPVGLARVTGVVESQPPQGEKCDTGAGTKVEPSNPRFLEKPELSAEFVWESQARTTNHVQYIICMSFWVSWSSDRNPKSKPSNVKSQLHIPQPAFWLRQMAQRLTLFICKKQEDHMNK